MCEKVAIMQPYLFPYIGYFQLIKSVDVFVFYDDVNFIKRGWINRNKLLINGKESMFSVPLSKASQNKKINEVEVLKEANPLLQLLKTLEINYKKAPNFEAVINLVKDISRMPYRTISDLAINAILIISNYLGLRVSFQISSEKFADTKGLAKADRLIKIAKLLKAEKYINPIGGLNLYSKNYFKNHEVTLCFLKSEMVYYKQFKNEPIAGLSILDVLMFNSKEETIKLIEHYKLE